MSEAMATNTDSLRGVPHGTPSPVTGFVRWLRAHRGAVTMAGVLSFAAPITFFAGVTSVMREPSAVDLLELIAWLFLFGFELWGLLLVIGYALQHVAATRHALSATLAGACAAAAIAELSNGRGHILVEQGVVQSAQTMHAYAFIFSFIMALLFFAHLNRSRAREEAAVRLAAAQAAQREARRRVGHARLQALQARIDPQSVDTPLGDQIQDLALLLALDRWPPDWRSLGERNLASSRHAMPGSRSALSRAGCLL